MADVLKPARRPKRASPTSSEPEQEAFCPIAIGSIEHVAVDLIELFPGNPRIHSERQIRVLAHIMSTTRVFVPIILDAKNRVLAGEGRLAAGRLLKMDTIPAIRAEGLSEAEMQTFRIADNRAVELGAWDERLLAISFRQLIDLKPNFSIEATGFLSGEIDIKLDSLRFGSTDFGEDPAVADRIPGISSATVSRPGDVWNCALHCVMCESCLNEDSMRILMKQKKAHMVLQDGPYNVSIARHASGLGAVKHKDFKMASGEMSREQFSTFLGERLRINASQCLKGAVVKSFMDWRSIDLPIKAGRDNGLVHQHVRLGQVERVDGIAVPFAA